MNPVRQKTPRWVWAVFLLLAVALQVPLLALFYKSATAERATEIQAKTRPVRLTLSPRAVPRPKKDTEKPPEEEPIKGQVITQRPPEREEKPDKPTRYLANVDRKVKVETKARRPARLRKKRRGTAVRKASKIQSARSRSVEETTAPKLTAEEPRLRRRILEAPKSDQGEAAPRSDMARDADTHALLPTIDKQSALANIQALSGDGWSDDAILDDMKRGDETMLNSRKFEHWDFFNDVKNRVRKHWQPARIYRRRDPTGKVYGLKDRLTVLRVTLDRRGKLKKLQTLKDSGVDFLDLEARRAFKQAAPFKNPPRGLINKHNAITFRFSFLFEISTGRFRFFRM